MKISVTLMDALDRIFRTANTIPHSDREAVTQLRAIKRAAIDALRRHNKNTAAATDSRSLQ